VDKLCKHVGKLREQALEQDREEGQAFKTDKHKRGRLASNHTLIPLSNVDIVCFQLSPAVAAILNFISEQKTLRL
jgi:hypothetical protein